MDAGFFRSRQFAVAAAVAVLVLAAGGVVLALGNGPGGSFLRADAGCGPLAVPGAEVQAERKADAADGGKARDESYVVDASDLAGIDACVAVGELLVVPSVDGKVRVEVHVRSDVEEATRETVVEARFARGPEGLRVAVWEPRVGYTGDIFGSRQAAQVIVTVQVPDGAQPRLDGDVHVGDLRVEDVMLGSAAVSVDVGGLRVLRVGLAGDLETRVDVGDTIVHLDSVQTGALNVASDVGDVELRLPTRADVGYDVTAESSVGSVEVRIGETENYRESGDGPGSSVHARSRGYDQLPTRVRVTVAADVGSVLVSAGGEARA